MKKLLFIAIVFMMSFGASAAPLTDTVYVAVGNISKTANINVVDKVTNSSVPSNVTNIVIQNNNPDFATVAINSINPKAITVTPIASGSGTATVTCHVTYIDAGDGLSKSEDKTIVIAYTVVFTPPHGVKLSLSFN